MRLRQQARGRVRDVALACGPRLRAPEHMPTLTGLTSVRLGWGDLRERTTHTYYTVGMRQVPMRELNQHTAEVMARVEMGERVEITRNGTRVAIIEPAQPHPLGLLIESGDLSPARGPLPTFSREDETASDSAGLDAVLKDRYGDGRW